MPNRSAVSLVLFLALLLLPVMTANLAAQPYKMEVHPAVQEGVSEPLGKIQPVPAPHKGWYVRQLLPTPVKLQPQVADPVLQAAAPIPTAAALGTGFEGVTSVVSGQPIATIPSDANLAVGPNHIVQWVNIYFAVYDKSGNLLGGPFPGNSLWTGFGGPCETQNQGDPIVQYDRQADRWVMTQFANTSSSGPYYQCFAVSQTSNPLGKYNLYAFAFSYFNDYTKLTVWSNAYFTSHNMYLPFLGSFLPVGAEACAFDRSAMIAGSSATGICFQDGSHLSLLPSDLDGPTLPPNGSPGFYVNYGGNMASLNLWQFNPNFANPNASVFSGPTSIPAAAFSLACSNGGTCVPQLGTTQQLATLGDRMMYRLAYRRFADHESLVVNQTVAAGNTVGIRWYEIRSPASSPFIFQQGTYGPDSSYRWMGSIAMDQAGNIALGYSKSDATMNPSIYITGRESTDQLGQMQAEQVIINGTGSQTGYDRWGDYTAMRIDPSDDCTFWYTNEYLPSDGAFNWHTRIASFKFSSCGPATPDFGISTSPASQSVPVGTPATYTVTITPSNSFSGSVSLGVSGLPAGANGSFNPPSVSGGSGTSTLTVSNAGTGNSTLTITGTSGNLNHSTSAALAVTDFNISASPLSSSVTQGGSTQYTVTIGAVNGFGGTVGFGASGLPSGAQASFSPTTVTGSGNTTMTVTTQSSTPTGSFTLTITGANGTLTHTAQVTLQVNQAPVADFTISASPASQTVTRGGSPTYTVTVSALYGFSGTVNLSVSGLPPKATASFNPASIVGSGSSTLKVATSKKSSKGTFTLTIKGTSGGLVHSTQVTLTQN